MRKVYMAGAIIIVLLASSCTKGSERKGEGSPKESRAKETLVEGEKIQFIEEPGLTLEEAFTLQMSYFTDEGVKTKEEWYKGYVDSIGLVRRIEEKYTQYYEVDRSGNMKKSLLESEDIVTIKKTDRGYYFDSKDDKGTYTYFDHYIMTNEGFTIVDTMTFLTDEAIQLNGKTKTSTEHVKYLDGSNGYIWQSDYKKARIDGSRYLEEDYITNDYDNIIYDNTVIYRYKEFDQVTKEPLMKYRYIFHYTKDNSSGEIIGKLISFSENKRAIFDAPKDEWEKYHWKIEMHLKRNLHSENMHINVLNQFLLPYRDYFIPFLYDLIKL